MIVNNCLGCVQCGQVEKGARESEFIWSKNGNRITFTPWSPGDPNDKEGNENCIEMFGATGVWNDRKCDYNTFFMCEKNLNR